MLKRVLVLTTAILVVVSVYAMAADDVRKEMEGLPLVYQDNFDKGADRWEPTDGQAWKVLDEDGNKVYALVGESQYEPPVRSPKNMSLIKDLPLGDFIVEARIKQTGREYGHRDFCVFFGYNDPSHFYYVHFASKADPHAHSVFLVNGEPRVSIAKDRTDGVKWDDRYHKIRIVRKTDSGLIRVFFDDMSKPIMTAEDKTFLRGRVGFGSFDDTGNVDDVCIWGKKIEPVAESK